MATEQRCPHGRLAVLLATFDGVRFLDAQLQSVANQKWPAIDVFASDDGSRDGTQAALAQWQARWSKGTFSITQVSRLGFADNFRSLLVNSDAKADYVAYCDQDDIWLADKTAVAVAALAPYAGQPALYCARTLITDTDDRERALSPHFARPPTFANALVQSISGGNTMVMNRAAFELVREGARRTDFVSHDWFAYLLVTGAGGRVIYSDVPHVRYRQHDANMVGANRGLAAILQRMKLALRGRFGSWTDHNVQALEACRDLLTKDALARFDLFRSARSGPPLQRIERLYRSGVYRQTPLGQFLLYVAGLTGKL